MLEYGIGEARETQLKMCVVFFFLICLVALGLGCDMQNSQLWHEGSSSLSRDRTQAPCVGNAV